MTDKKDEFVNDPTLQEEVIPSENDAATEEWQSELPPEDDFRDQPDYHEGLEDELVDEAISDSAYDDGTATEAPKRGKGMLVVAVIVGVVFIGGLSYLQFGIDKSGGEGSALLPVSAVLNVRDLKKEQAPQPKPSEQEEPKVAEVIAQTTNKVDLDKIFDAGRAKTSGGATALPNGEMPEVVAEKPMEAMTSEVLASHPAPAEEPAAAVVTPPPSYFDEKAKEEDKSKTAIPAMENPPQIAKIENIPVAKADTEKKKESEETEKRLKDLNTQVESLQKSLNDAMRKNEELLAKVETLSKKEKAPASTVTAPAAFDGTMGETFVSPVAETPKKEEVKKVEKRTAVAKKKTAPAKKSVAKKEAPAMVLRAATPNAAWVAPDVNSTELRRVIVGETLPVIGQVKEIRQTGGTWEIVGANGTLK